MALLEADPVEQGVLEVATEFAELHRMAVENAVAEGQAETFAQRIYGG